MKFVESNLPEGVHARVVHLHEGNTSRNQLKRLAKTNAKYVTLVRLYDHTDHELAVGVAACSKVDQPSRAIGRAIAMGRALKELYDV